MKCLSIRQPWAFAIAHGFKLVENRDWPTKFRGEFLIHAGLREDKDSIHWVMHRIAEQEHQRVEEIEQLYQRHRALGATVGQAEIVDCVTEMRSHWFFGEYGFVIENAAPCEPIPFKGRLGFFEGSK